MGAALAGGAVLIHRHAVYCDDCDHLAGHRLGADGISTTVRGLQQTIVVPGTTTVLGLNISNTTHIATLAASSTPTGWYTQATQAAGATPGGTEAFTILPVMFDHKVFSAINVVNLDSIQFTYSLSVNSGG
jgi:hypothetical protein